MIRWVGVVLSGGWAWHDQVGGCDRMGGHGLIRLAGCCPWLGMVC